MHVPQSYADRLGHHIDTYLALVAQCPDVRLQEFVCLAETAALPDRAAVLEVPAEGPLLDRLLPTAGITRAELVKTAAVSGKSPILHTDWALSTIPPAAYDAVVSLAPMHHADDAQKRAYAAGAYRVLRPNGVFAFGEVEAGSAAAEFLDGYVNDHSPGGHRGAYPTADYEDTMRAAGFSAVCSESRDFHWVFPDDAMLEMYLTRLFRLEPQPAGSVVAAVEKDLGLVRHAGEVRMNWGLRYFRGIKHGRESRA